MLFNSYPFIFEFMPLMLGIYFLTARVSHRAAIYALWIGSLIFYSGWNSFPWLIIRVIFLQLCDGAADPALSDPRPEKIPEYFPGRRHLRQPRVLIYFKYTNFLVANLDWAAGLRIPDPKILLPIGISFFTFTQIAFLVDVWRKEARNPISRNSAFSSPIFPPAGRPDHPPQGGDAQLNQPKTYHFSAANLAIGLTIFIGLVQEGRDSGLVHRHGGCAVRRQSHAAILRGWRGALAYTLQIYFDFSGYSDMAIGLRACSASSFPEFQFSVQIHQHHRLLAAVAHDPVAVPAGLCLHTLGGNSGGRMRRYATSM